MIEVKSRVMFYVGFGTAGPAITAGSMLLLYAVAIALFIGLGPLFILCLLFEQTKSLFQRWLFYGIGTLFSMAVLAAMTGIALDMVLRVSKAFWLESIGAKLILGPSSLHRHTRQLRPIHLAGQQNSMVAVVHWLSKVRMERLVLWRTTHSQFKKY
ncbi:MULTISPECIES: type IV secretion system protein [Stenotrophomonas]|uniref:type IV secretion system protein n=1 Tax=Stenotrophomonas TaxID=40323 RepID=UPI00269FF453